MYAHTSTQIYVYVSPTILPAIHYSFHSPNPYPLLGLMTIRSKHSISEDLAGLASLLMAPTDTTCDDESQRQTPPMDATLDEESQPQTTPIHSTHDDESRPQTAPSLPPHESPPFNKFVLWCAILASTNSVLLGYDIGVMSGAVLYIKDNLKISTAQEEIMVGSLNVFSLVGSLASGKTSDLIGRRLTIVLAAMTFLAGALLMGLAPSFLFLMAGRVVAGIGVGYALMIAPVYTAELAPAMSRGFLTSLPEVFINIGILLGYVMNFALSGLPESINWRLMLGFAAFPAILVTVGVLVMPESPRWLVMKGKVDRAKGILRKTSASEEEAELRLEEIVSASLAGAPGSSEATASGNWSGQGVWKELLWRPSWPVRRMLTAAIGVNFFMQASGNDSVVYYTPEVFRAAGIHNRKHLVGVTVIMGTAKTLCVLISALYLDRFGRRPLLLIGSAGMAVSLTVLGVGSWAFEHTDGKPTWAIVLCIVAVCTDVSFFSIGLGPITWVYSSEIFPTRLRAQGSSLAVSVNRLVSGAVAMSFLSIAKNISFGGMFFVLAGIMVLGIIFFYFIIPETRGKSLEEIGQLFEDKDTLISRDR